MLTVALDPGHPSHENDRGAVVPNLVESDYTIQFARFLKLRVEHSAEPFCVELLRHRQDEVVTLEERGARSHECKADLVLCIHVNSYTTDKLHGAMAFYWPGDEIGRELGDVWLDATLPPLHVRGRRSMAADPSRPGDEWLSRARAVLEPHDAIAVLLELGFCSHPGDLAALLDPATQSAMVASVQVMLARFRQMHERACWPSPINVGV